MTDDSRPVPSAVEGPTLAPVSAKERVLSLDVIRGIAVLGILLMNIVGFAFHVAVYADPTVAGGATGLNFWVYAINAVLVDGKMRGIFSMVFGAGVVILTTRALEGGRESDGADIHYRRMFWLMLFGVIHAFVLWWGEILYPYALMGLFLYPMRRASARALMISGAVLAVLLTGMMAVMAYRTVATHEAAMQAIAASESGRPLTPAQTDAKRGWEDRLKKVKPDARELHRVNDAFGGSFGAVFAERAKLVAEFHFVPYYFPIFWDMLCMMFFGMALVKTGVLTGERSNGFYVRMALIGYAIGVPLHVWMVWQNVRTGFDLIAMGFTSIPYEAARIAVCLGHVAVVMLIVKAGALRWMTSRLAAVGQMAFTNYVLQSVICSTIFYGYGFGLFGRLQRYEIYYVVLLCWVIHLVFSPWWLRHYRFGPLEWCWRSLTYWKRQPMRLVSAPASTPVVAPIAESAR